MANPQKEHGYVAIANELFEALAKIRIPGEARQCLDVILRKTYGWNERDKAISLDSFSKATNLSKPHICKGLRLLREMQIITQKGNGKRTIYCIQKDYEIWKSLPKRVILPNRVTIITQKGNPTIKDNIKDTMPEKMKKPKPTNPDLPKIISYFCDKWEKLSGSKYPFEAKKDAVALSKMLKNHGLEKAQWLIDCWFSDPDTWVAGTGYKASCIHYREAKYLTQTKPNETISKF